MFSEDAGATQLLGKSYGAKFEMAKMPAKRFPGELASRLSSKRKPWMSEHARMYIFEAVAVVWMFRLKQAE
jgi:hypothetical protein